MRDMRDSGLGYLGEIPVHWSTERIKNHLRFSPDKNPGDRMILSLYREHGIVPKDSRDDNHNVTSEDTSNYRYVRAGDFVVNKMKAWQGSMGVSDYEGVVSPAYYVYRFTTDAFDKKYLHYLLRSKCYADEFRRLSGGIRIGQWDLPKVGFETTYVAVPPKGEQTAIAATIDTQLKKVDTLIANVQAQIEKLKAYKQSVITEVVTKGLDPTAPMKDSGFDWIGEIPEHWDYIKSFYVYDKIGDIDHYMPESVAEGYPYVMTGDLKHTVSEIDFELCKKVSEQDYQQLSKKIVACKGDVIFARYATIGTVCYVDVDENFLVSYSCVTIKPKRSVVDGKYLWYYYQSLAFLEDVKKLINANTQANVGMESLYRAKLVIPSLAEQHELIAHLDEKCDQIDRLIAIKQAKIEKLEQYKRSLIYEYVTGKKEVSQYVG